MLIGIVKEIKPCIGYARDKYSNKVTIWFTNPSAVFQSILDIALHGKGPTVIRVQYNYMSCWEEKLFAANHKHL